MRNSFDFSTKLSNIQTARQSMDPLDVGIKQKNSRFNHIIDKKEVDLQKANNVQVAARLRSHRSNKKLKLKKPKKNDIFFG